MGSTTRKRLGWNKDYARWLVWLALIGVFVFLDKGKIAFRHISIWFVAFTVICFVFVIVFYLLRERE